MNSRDDGKGTDPARQAGWVGGGGREDSKMKESKIAR